MTLKIDDYDVDGWKRFYTENPGVLRSVGADAAHAEPAEPEPSEPAEPEAPAEPAEPAPKDDAPSEVDWRGLITDPDVKKEAEQANDLNAFGKRLVDMRKQLSQSIKVPGKDASEEELAKFNKAIGVPDDPSAYEFPEVEDISEEQQQSREVWAQRFHELKIPKQQAEKLVQLVHEDEQKALEAQNEADENFAKEQTETLKKEWGGDYKRNTEYASRALQKVSESAGVDFESLRNMELKSGRYLMDDANMLRILSTIGREMGEGTLGPVSEDDMKTIEQEIAQKDKEMREAQSRGDNRTADAKYREQQELYGKLAKAKG